MTDILVVEGAVADAPALPASEAHLVSARATEKRRRDVAGGRWVARRALAGLTGRRMEDIVVDRSVAEDAGRPIARDRAGHALDAFVSITHAGGRALAAASRSAVGIDHVVIEPQTSAFVDEVFAPRELEAWEALLRDWPDHVPLAAAFAAEEAALKILGTGLRASFHHVVLTPSRGRPVPIRGLVGVQESLTISASGTVGATLGELRATVDRHRGRVTLVMHP